MSLSSYLMNQETLSPTRWLFRRSSSDNSRGSNCSQVTIGSASWPPPSFRSLFKAEDNLDEFHDFALGSNQAPNSSLRDVPAKIPTQLYARNDVMSGKPFNNDNNNSNKNRRSSFHQQEKQFRQQEIHFEQKIQQEGYSNHAGNQAVPPPPQRKVGPSTQQTTQSMSGDGFCTETGREFYQRWMSNESIDASSNHEDRFNIGSSMGQFSCPEPEPIPYAPQMQHKRRRSSGTSISLYEAAKIIASSSSSHHPTQISQGEEGTVEPTNVNPYSTFSTAAESLAYAHQLMPQQGMLQLAPQSIYPMASISNSSFHQDVSLSSFSRHFHAYSQSEPGIDSAQVATTKPFFQSNPNIRSPHAPTGAPDDNNTSVLTSSVCIEGDRIIPMARCDENNLLSDYQCLLRKQVCYVIADQQLYNDGVIQGRNQAIVNGQVGILCRHWAQLPKNKRPSGSVYYPSKLCRVYQASQNMARNHLLINCRTVPIALKEQLRVLKSEKSQQSGATKAYWSSSAQGAGLVEFDQRLFYREVPPPTANLNDAQNPPSFP